MAIKRAAQQQANIDWYLISIDRLKQIGLITVSYTHLTLPTIYSV